MKILMLTPYLPFPLLTGGQTRSYNLIKRLAGLGHEITLFCLIKNDEELKYKSELEKYCREVQIFRRSKKPWTLKNILTTGFSLFPFLVIRNWASGEKQAIKQKLDRENFDLIHAETFYVMPHIPKTKIPILLVEQTIEYLVYRHFANNTILLPIKPLLFLDVMKMRFWELRYWKQATKVAAMSEDDKKIMRSQIPDLQVDIVPNGVDTSFFGDKIYQRSAKPTVLYLGNFTWLQNREAVEVLVSKVWPKIKSQVQDAKLWIIGKGAKEFFGKLADQDIRIDEVEDVREAYQSAWVLVAPIYGGGGTRYKNFEAFASGLPVVTTSVGIGGTDAKNEVEVLVRDEPESIAQAAVSLITDKNLYSTIAINAKKMVAKNYDWAPIAKQLGGIYEELGAK